MARVDFRRPAVWIPTVLGLGLAGLIIFRVIEASTPQEAPASVEQIRAEQGVPVSVAEVERGFLSIWRSFSGNVSGAQEGVVRARSGDEVTTVAVDVGARVSRGQVLVRQSGQASSARVRQAEAARVQAQRTVDRLQPLHEAGAISDQEWEQALTQLELASADLAAASDILTLTSPLAGVVTEVSARPGMIPSPGDVLVRVADLSELVVYLRVSAAEVREIREGQRARLAGDGAEGRVRRVALQADPESRLVEVEVGFPPSAGLVPGTLAVVEIEVAALDDVIQVPRSAVTAGGVWVVDTDSTATRRPVQIGLQSTDRVEIVSGLQVGEQVVVSGGTLLSEGARVQIVGGAGGN